MKLKKTIPLIIVFALVCVLSTYNSNKTIDGGN